MKQTALLFLLTFLCFSEELTTGELTTITEGAVLLSDGIVEYSRNDSGSAITTSSAKMWVAGKDENVHLITPAAIISCNGTAYVEITKQQVSLSVYKGYLRILSLGGIPGETVSAGYSRLINASGEIRQRELIVSDPFDSLCAIYNDTMIGCIAPLSIQPADTTPIDSENKINKIVVINPLTYSKEIQSELDTLSIRKHIADFFKSHETIETIMTNKQNQYVKPLELSRQSTPFFIIDIHIEQHSQEPNSVSITMRVFSGIEKEVVKSRFIVNIETLKSESNDSFLSQYKSTLYSKMKSWTLSVI